MHFHSIGIDYCYILTKYGSHVNSFVSQSNPPSIVKPDEVLTTAGLTRQT